MNKSSLWAEINAQGCQEQSINDMSSWGEVEQWDNSSKSADADK